MRIMLVSGVEEDLPKIMNTENKLFVHLKKRGHEVLFFHQKPNSGMLYFLWMFISFLKNYIFFKPDIVLSFHQIGFIPALYRKLGLIKKPLIRYSWDSYTEINGRDRSPALMAFIEYFSLKNCDYVFTNSKLQESICHNLNIHCQHFQLGVEPFFRNARKPVTMPYFGKKVEVLYVGEQSQYKRTGELLNAFRGIKNADLILIGKINPEYMEDFKSGNIHFLGEVPHEDIPHYIKRADIVVISSDQDGTLKMYEYLKMGKAILAFKGRIGYILTHGENVWLDNDFKKGLKTLIDCPDIRYALEKGAKEYKVLSLDESLDLHVKKMKEILSVLEAANENN